MGEKLTCLVSSGFLLVSIENWFCLVNRTELPDLFIWGDFIAEKRIDLAGLLTYRRI